MNLKESLIRTQVALREKWNKNERERAENALGDALKFKLFHNFYDGLKGAAFEREESIMGELDGIVATRGLRIGRVVQRAVAVIRGINLTEEEAEAGYRYYRLFLQDIGDEKVNFFYDEKSRGMQFLTKCKEEGLDCERVVEVEAAFGNPGDEAI